MKGKTLYEVFTHGGIRPGAGRKRGVARKPVTVRLSEPARDALAAIKRQTGKGYSAILEALLTGEK